MRYFIKDNKVVSISKKSIIVNNLGDELYYDNNSKKYYPLDYDEELTNKYDWKNLVSLDYDNTFYKLGKKDYYNKLDKYVLFYDDRIYENEKDIINTILNNSNNGTYLYFQNFYDGSKDDFIQNLSDDVYIINETRDDRYMYVLEQYFDSITLVEFNEDNGTDFSSVEDVVKSDFEHYFTKNDVADWLWDSYE